MTYDDGGVALTEDGLVIRRYYFPFGDKRIPYGEIERVQRAANVGLDGRLADLGKRRLHALVQPRPRPAAPKTVKFVVETSGGRTLPCDAPNDPDTVQAEFTAHGVNVTTG